MTFDGLTLKQEAVASSDVKGVVFQENTGFAKFYDRIGDLTINNCIFIAKDNSGNSIPALLGNGKFGGTLTIVGNTFQTIFKGAVIKTGLATAGDVTQVSKLTKVVFNKNSMTTVEGSVEFHAHQSHPMDTC